MQLVYIIREMEKDKGESEGAQAENNSSDQSMSMSMRLAVHALGKKFPTVKNMSTGELAKHLRKSRDSNLVDQPCVVVLVSITLAI